MTGRHATTWAFAVLTATSLAVAACAPGARPATPGSAAGPAQSPPAPAAEPAQPAVAAPDAFAVAKELSLDELHQRALAEGGTLVFYSTLSQNNTVLPAFERRFPGIKVEHVDATGDKLVSRVVAEARGGRVLADVFQTSVDYVLQVNQQGLLLQDIPPEAMALPEDFRGRYWTGTFVNFEVPAWNTNLTRHEEAPRTFEDFADPRWKGRLIADARSAEMMMALALRKYGNDEQAADLFRRIAANEPEFHRGHSELAELLVAGHAAACPTCSAHHYPPRMKRGAPVDYSQVEGVTSISATSILKDAPHPYAAMLWARWNQSEEGQQAYNETGRVPALPSITPIEKLRPERIYALGPEDHANIAKYERQWKEIFQLR
jgi:iron(III) transport system substrate-binding protein